MRAVDHASRRRCISLEGWSETMYMLQDAFSSWVWIYFVLLVSVCVLRQRRTLARAHVHCQAHAEENLRAHARTQARTHARTHSRTHAHAHEHVHTPSTVAFTPAHKRAYDGAHKRTSARARSPTHAQLIIRACEPASRMRSRALSSIVCFLPLLDAPGGVWSIFCDQSLLGGHLRLVLQGTGSRSLEAPRQVEPVRAKVQIRYFVFFAHFKTALTTTQEGALDIWGTA
eukprot:6197296-Pleurochrysis_carterae.AAC.1